MTESCVRRHVQLGPDAVSYLVAGSGPTVTLLHPVGLTASCFQPHIELLSESLRVVAVDLPGHGKSSRPVEISFGTMAAAVRSVWADLAVRSSAVLGVSLGGMVAQELATTGEDVSALILVSTAASLPDPARGAVRQRAALVSELGALAAARPTLERWFGPDSADSDVRREIGHTLESSDSDVQAACWIAISELNFTSRLRSVACKALVVVGDHDLSVPVEAAKELCAGIPNSQLEILSGGGHLVAFEDPGALVALTSRFLNSLSTG